MCSNIIRTFLQIRTILIGNFRPPQRPWPSCNFPSCMCTSVIFIFQPCIDGSVAIFDTLPIKTFKPSPFLLQTLNNSNICSTHRAAVANIQLVVLHLQLSLEMAHDHAQLTCLKIAFRHMVTDLSTYISAETFCQNGKDPHAHDHICSCTLSWTCYKCDQNKFKCKNKSFFNKKTNSN